jgi:AcrR family transcriptional regulator
MVEATVELLRSTPPDRITVRAVAEQAGHSHYLIGGWFGSKSGLLRAALDYLVGRIPIQILPLDAAAPGIAADTRVAMQLIAWLAVNDLDRNTDPPTKVFRDALYERYITVGGFAPDLADLLARRSTASILALAIFADALGFNDATLAELRVLEQRQTMLLAAEADIR